MSQLADDLASIFADPMGKVLVAGGVADDTYGVLTWEDVPESDATGYSVLTHRQQVVVSTDWVTATGLAQGDPITVDAIDYVVRDLRHETHGAITRVIIT